MLLKGEIAIITGGARGIGKEIAIALAKAGANLVIVLSFLSAWFCSFTKDEFNCLRSLSDRQDNSSVTDTLLRLTLL